MTVAERALEVALSHLGERETGPNQGPIVDWAIAPWTAAHAGPWALWCAGFVSSCILQALQEQLPVAEHLWRQVGSLSVDALWRRLGRLPRRQRAEERIGWTWRDPARPVLPGDLVFFSYSDDPQAERRGLRHVGLVERLDGGELHTVEGNAGDAVRRRTYHLSSPQLYGFARLPW